MDELKKLFLENGVKEDIVDDVLEQLGFQSIADMIYIKKAEQLEKVGVKTVLAQEKLLEYAQNMRDTKAAREAEAKAQTQPAREPDMSLLASDIAEEDWMQALEQDGFLNFENQTYLAGFKAILAKNMGVFKSVERLERMVYEYAIKNARPAPLFYYDLQAILTRRKYGLIFAVSNQQSDRYKGVPIYATSEDVDQLMGRIDTFLVPAVLDTAQTLSDWFGKLNSMSQSDFFMNATLGMEIPQNSYPSTAALYDAGKNLRISINQTFAGNGIQKALAIHNEYKCFVDVLNNENLAESVGAVDRDAVLTALGFNPNAAAVRSEKYILKYVISMIDVEKLAAKNEMIFFRELYNLMRQIDWSALTGNPADSDRFSVVPTILHGMTTPIIPNLAPVAPTPAIASLDSPKLVQMDGQVIAEN